MGRQRNTYWAQQKLLGKEWQEKRYRENKMVWGTDPGPTAPVAEVFFSQHRLRKLLVIGCGYGRECIYFARKGFEVTGVDTSLEGLKLAREWMTRERVMNIKFELGDALNLHYDEANFDGVFTHKVLHQFNREDRQAMMNEIHRVLRPGGLFFLSDLSVSDPEFGSGEEIESRTFERPHRPYRPIHFLSMDHLEEMEGFRLVHVEEVGHWEIHPGESTEHQHFFLQIIGQKPD